MHARQTIATAMILGVVVATGCRVSSDKHGDSNDVKIATPFGGMQVKTNDAVVLNEIGLPAYPGAVLVKKDNGKNDGAADVNFSFGSFQLKVKAAQVPDHGQPGEGERLLPAGAGEVWRRDSMPEQQGHWHALPRRAKG